MIKATNNGFELKSNSLYLKIGIMATFMECIGLYFFLPMLFEFDGSIGDWVAAAFVCLWLGGVLFGALISFYKYSEKLIICEDGVSYSSMLGKRHLAWHEIQDYGLSYDGRVQDGANFSNSYILYFSKKKQENKSQFKKKLSKEVLKISVSSEDHACFRENVIPFCASKTEIQPFVPEDVPHVF